MKHLRLIILALVFLSTVPSIAHAQGAGIEWDTLNQEVVELYLAGKYDRAVVVAGTALEVAEQYVGPDHQLSQLRFQLAILISKLPQLAGLRHCLSSLELPTVTLENVRIPRVRPDLNRWIDVEYWQRTF